MTRVNLLSRYDTIDFTSLKYQAMKYRYLQGLGNFAIYKIYCNKIYNRTCQKSFLFQRCLHSLSTGSWIIIV